MKTATLVFGKGGEPKFVTKTYSKQTSSETVNTTGSNVMRRPVVKLKVPKKRKTVTPSILRTTTLKPGTTSNLNKIPDQRFTPLELTNTSVHVQQLSSEKMNEDDEVISKTKPNFIIKPTNPVVKLKVPKKPKTSTLEPVTTNWNLSNKTMDEDNEDVSQTRHNVMVKPTNAVVKLKIPSKFKTSTPLFLHSTTVKPVSINWDLNQSTHQRFTPFELTNAPIKLPFEETTNSKEPELTNETTTLAISTSLSVSTNTVEVTSIVIDHDEGVLDYGSDVNKMNETKNDLLSMTASNKTPAPESTSELKKPSTISIASIDQKTVTHGMETQEIEETGSLVTLNPIEATIHTNHFATSTTSEEASSPLVFDEFGVVATIDLDKLSESSITLAPTTVFQQTSEKTVVKTIEQTTKDMSSTVASDEFGAIATIDLDKLAESSIDTVPPEAVTPTTVLFTSSTTSEKAVDNTVPLPTLNADENMSLNYEPLNEKSKTSVNPNAKLFSFGSKTSSVSKEAETPFSPITLDINSLTPLLTKYIISTSQMPMFGVPSSATTLETPEVDTEIDVLEEAINKTLLKDIKIMQDNSLGIFSTKVLSPQLVSTTPTPTSTFEVATLARMSQTSSEKQTILQVASEIKAPEVSPPPTSTAFKEQTISQEVQSEIIFPTQGPLPLVTPEIIVNPKLPTELSQLSSEMSQPNPEYMLTTFAAGSEAAENEATSTEFLPSVNIEIIGAPLLTSEVFETASNIPQEETLSEIPLSIPLVGATITEIATFPAEVTSEIFEVQSQILTTEFDNLEISFNTETIATTNAPFSFPTMIILENVTFPIEALPETSEPSQVLDILASETLEGAAVSTKASQSTSEVLQTSQAYMLTSSSIASASMLQEGQPSEVAATSEEFPQDTNAATLESAAVSSEETDIASEGLQSQQYMLTSSLAVSGSMLQEEQSSVVPTTSEDLQQATNAATSEGRAKSTELSQDVSEVLQTTSSSVVSEPMLQEGQSSEISAASEVLPQATLEGAAISSEETEIASEVLQASQKYLSTSSSVASEAMLQEGQPSAVAATSEELAQVPTATNTEGAVESTGISQISSEVPQTSPEYMATSASVTSEVSASSEEEGVALSSEETKIASEVLETSQEYLSTSSSVVSEPMLQEGPSSETSATSEEFPQATNATALAGTAVSSEETNIAPEVLQTGSEYMAISSSIASEPMLQEGQSPEVAASSEGAAVSSEETQIASELLQTNQEYMLTSSLTASEAMLQKEQSSGIAVTSEEAQQVSNAATSEGAVESTEESQIATEVLQTSQEYMATSSLITSETILQEGHSPEIATSSEELQRVNAATSEGAAESTEASQIASEVLQTSKEYMAPSSLIVSQTILQEGQSPEVATSSEETQHVTNAATSEGAAESIEESQIASEVLQTTQEYMLTSSSAASEPMLKEGQSPEVATSSGEIQHVTNAATSEGAAESTEASQIASEVLQTSEEYMAPSSSRVSQTILQEGQSPDVATSSEELQHITNAATSEGAAESIEESQIASEVLQTTQEYMLTSSSAASEPMLQEGQSPEVATSSEETQHVTNAATSEGAVESTEESQIASEVLQTTQEYMLASSSAVSEPMLQEGQSPEVATSSEELQHVTNAATSEGAAESMEESRITSEVLQTTQEYTLTSPSGASESVLQEGQSTEVVASLEALTQVTNAATSEGAAESVEESQTASEVLQVTQEYMLTTSSLASEPMLQEGQFTEVAASSEALSEVTSTAILEGTAKSTEESQKASDVLQTSQEYMATSSLTASETILQEGPSPEVATSSEALPQDTNAATSEGTVKSLEEAQIASEVLQATQEYMLTSSLTALATMLQEGQSPEVVATSEEQAQFTNAATVQGPAESTEASQIASEVLQTIQEYMSTSSVTASTTMLQEGQPPEVAASSKALPEVTNTASSEGAAVATEESQMVSEPLQTSLEYMSTSSVTASETMLQEGQPPEIAISSEELQHVSNAVTLEGAAESTEVSQIASEVLQASQELTSLTASETMLQEAQFPEIAATSKELPQVTNTARLEIAEMSSEVSKVVSEVLQASQEYMLTSSPTAAETILQERQSPEVARTSKEQVTNAATLEGAVVSTEISQISSEVLQTSQEYMLTSSSVASEPMLQEGQLSEVAATSGKLPQVTNVGISEGATESTEVSQPASEVLPTSREYMSASFPTPSEIVLQEAQAPEVTVTSKELLQITSAATIEGATVSTELPQITPEVSAASQEHMFTSSPTISEAVSQEVQSPENKATLKELSQVTSAATIKGATISTELPQISPEFSAASQEHMFASSARVSEAVSQEGQSPQVTSAATFEGAAVSTKKPQVSPEFSPASPKNMFSSFATATVPEESRTPENQLSSEELPLVTGVTGFEGAKVSTEVSQTVSNIPQTSLAHRLMSSTTASEVVSQEFQPPVVKLTTELPQLTNTATFEGGTISTQFSQERTEESVSFITTNAFGIATLPEEITSEDLEVSSQIPDAETELETSGNTANTTNKDRLTFPTILVLGNITLPEEATFETSELFAETSQLQSANIVTGVSQVKIPLISTESYSLPTGITSTNYEISLPSVSEIITLSTETIPQSLYFSSKSQLPTTEITLHHSSESSFAEEHLSSMYEKENKSSFQTSSIEASQVVPITNYSGIEYSISSTFSSSLSGLYSSELNQTLLSTNATTVDVDNPEINILDVAFHSLHTNKSVNELVEKENILETSSKVTQKTFDITSSMGTAEVSKSSDLTQLLTSKILKELLNNHTTTESMKPHGQSLNEELEHSLNYKETASSSVYEIRTISKIEKFTSGIFNEKEITEGYTSTIKPHNEEEVHASISSLSNKSTAKIHKHTEITDGGITRRPTNEMLAEEFKHFKNHETSTLCVICNVTEAAGKASTIEIPKLSHSLSTRVPHKHTEVTESKTSSAKPLEEIMDEQLKHFPGQEKSTLCEICNVTEAVGKASTIEKPKSSHSISTQVLHKHTEVTETKTSSVKPLEEIMDEQLKHFPGQEKSTLCEICNVTEEFGKASTIEAPKSSNSLSTRVPHKHTEVTESKTSSAKPLEEIMDEQLKHFPGQEKSTLCEICNQTESAAKESTIEPPKLSRSLSTYLPHKHTKVLTDSKTSPSKPVEEVMDEQLKHFPAHEQSTLCELCNATQSSNLYHSSVTQKLKTLNHEEDTALHQLSSTEAQLQKGVTESHILSKNPTKEVDGGEEVKHSSNDDFRKKTSSTQTANEATATKLPGEETQNTLVLTTSNNLLTKSTLVSAEITTEVTSDGEKHSPINEGSTNESTNEEKKESSVHDEGSAKTSANEIITGTTNEEVTKTASEPTGEDGVHSSIEGSAETTLGATIKEKKQSLNLEEISKGITSEMTNAVHPSGGNVTAETTNEETQYSSITEASTKLLVDEVTSEEWKQSSLPGALAERTVSKINIKVTGDEKSYSITHEGSSGETINVEEKHSPTDEEVTKTVNGATGEETLQSSIHLASTETAAGEITAEATNEEGKRSSTHEGLTKTVSVAIGGEIIGSSIHGDLTVSEITTEATKKEEKHSSTEKVTQTDSGATSEEKIQSSIHEVPAEISAAEITTKVINIEGKHYSAHEEVTTVVSGATDEERMQSSSHEAPAKISAGEITTQVTNVEGKHSSAHEEITTSVSEATDEEITQSSIHKASTETFVEATNEIVKQSFSHGGLVETSTEILNTQSRYEEKEHSLTNEQSLATFKVTNEENNHSLHNGESTELTPTEPVENKVIKDFSYQATEFAVSTSNASRTESVTFGTENLEASLHSALTSNVTSHNEISEPDAMSSPVDEAHLSKSPKWQTTSQIPEETHSHNPAEVSVASEAYKETTFTPIHINLPVYLKNSTASLISFEKYYSITMTSTTTSTESTIPDAPASTIIVDDEATDCVLNKDAFRSMKLQDFRFITEFPPTTISTDATGTCSLLGKLVASSTTSKTESKKTQSTEKILEGTGLPQKEAISSTYSAHSVYNSQTEMGGISTQPPEGSSFQSETTHSNGAFSILSGKVEENSSLPQKEAETSTYSAHSVYNGQSELENKITELLESSSVHTEHSLNSGSPFENTGAREYLNTTESAHESTRSTSGIKYSQPYITAYPKMQEESTCKLSEFEAHSYCICSIDNLVKDLRIKFSHSSPEVNMYNYTCPILSHIETGIILGNSSIPQVSRRRSDKKGFSIRKREIIDNPNIEKTLNQQLELIGKENEIFANPGMKVRIPCMQENSAGISENIINYTWTFSDNLPLTEGKVQENEGALTIEYISAQDGGNYTCTVVSGSGDSKNRKTFQHHLSVVALPTYTISTSILYNSTEKCQSGDADILSLYLPNVLGSFICGSYFPVCNLEVKDAQCVNKSEDYISANLTTIVEPMNVIMPTLNASVCDVNCKMNMYTRIVLFIIKNLETIETLPVFFRLAYRQQKLVPTERIVKKVRNEIGTEAPKLVIACPPGFGYHRKTHICGACDRNTFSRGDETFCSTCPAGQYQPMVGSKSCLACSSPLQDPFCLRVVYSNSHKFRIVIGVTASILVVMIILLLFCLRSSKPSHSSANAKIGREEYLKTKRHSKRRSRYIDVEKQEDAEPLLTDKHRSRKNKNNKKPPEPPPPDFF